VTLTIPTIGGGISCEKKGLDVYFSILLLWWHTKINLAVRKKFKAFSAGLV